MHSTHPPTSTHNLRTNKTLTNATQTTTRSPSTGPQQPLLPFTTTTKFNNTLITARCHLRALLADRNLTFLQNGFPFRYTHGYDSRNNQSWYHASYEPYEIHEEIVVPSGTGTYTRLLLTLSYEPPSSTMDPRCPSKKFFSWTLFLSTPTDPRLSPTSPLRVRPVSPKANVAQILIDPYLLNSPSHVEFGQLIIDNPEITLHALSLSLELGICISIYHSSSISQSSRIIQRHPKFKFKFCHSGSGGTDTMQSGIVYVGTDNEGEQSVLFSVGLTSTCWLNMLKAGKVTTL